MAGTRTRQGRAVDPKVRDRAVRMFGDGYSASAVAKKVGVDRKSITNWARRAGVVRGGMSGEAKRGAVPADWGRAEGTFQAAMGEDAEPDSRGGKLLSLATSGARAIPGLDPGEQQAFLAAVKVGMSFRDIGAELGWAPKRVSRLVQALSIADRLPEDDPDYDLVMAFRKARAEGKREVLKRLHAGDPGYRALQAWLGGVEPGGAWDSRQVAGPAEERPLSDMSDADLLAVVEQAEAS